MAGVGQTLEHQAAHLEESLGRRAVERMPRLAPRASSKDASRRPLRQFGRVCVSDILPDPDQPRQEFAEEALERLAQSLRTKGQLSPIRVRWSERHHKWVIVCGERRWRAAVRAGLQEIDCSFQEADLEPAAVLEQQLIENCLREDLQPLEEAKAFAKLMEFHGWTGKELAGALQVAPSRVSRALALLRLPADIQDRVAAGQLAARSAYELSKLKNPGTQRELAAHGALSPAQAARAVRQRQGRARTYGVRQTFFTERGWTVVVSAPRKGTYHDIEQALSQALEEVRHRIDNQRELY